MKLDKFPEILWINLEESIDRRKYMEKLLRNHDLAGVRIPAIRGELNNEIYRNICIPNKNYLATENACTCSHLSALKYFVEKMESEYIVIFEDDVSFEFLEFIPFSWCELMSYLPKNFNVVQLATSAENANIELCEINADSKSYGTIAYLIKKSAAVELLQQYYSWQQKKFIFSDKKYVTADTVLYSLPNTYRIPVFTYTNTDSTIHNGHLPKHSTSKNHQKKLWQSII